MPGGRPRLDVRRSPYLAGAALALALEKRFRVRPVIIRPGKPFRVRSLSLRAAMRIAALAIRGEPINPAASSTTKISPDGRGGLYAVVKRYTHAASGRIEEVAAVEQSIRRVIEAGERNAVDLELLDELSSELLAIMLRRDPESAWRRITMALGDDAEAFLSGIGKVARALTAA